MPPNRMPYTGWEDELPPDLRKLYPRYERIWNLAHHIIMSNLPHHCTPDESYQCGRPAIIAMPGHPFTRWLSFHPFWAVAPSTDDPPFAFAFYTTYGNDLLGILTAFNPGLDYILNILPELNDYLTIQTWLPARPRSAKMDYAGYHDPSHRQIEAHFRKHLGLPPPLPPKDSQCIHKAWYLVPWLEGSDHALHVEQIVRSTKGDPDD